jgi:hypothetical protein
VDEINLAVAEILADEAVHPSLWPEQGEDESESLQSPVKDEAVADVPPKMVPLSPIGKSPVGSVDGTVSAISLRADEDETWLFPSPVHVDVKDLVYDIRANHYERTVLDARYQQVPRPGESAFTFG